MSNNGVPLKSGFGLAQSHKNGTIRQIMRLPISLLLYHIRVICRDLEI